MTVLWERSGEAYYATVTGPDGEVRFQMIVEPAGDRWDWAVWRAGEDQFVASHGVVRTVQDAMREAEGVEHRRKT
jgi:hypothetical protein